MGQAARLLGSVRHFVSPGQSGLQGAGNRINLAAMQIVPNMPQAIESSYCSTVTMPNASDHEDNEPKSTPPQNPQPTGQPFAGSFSNSEPPKTSLGEVIGAVVLVVGLIGFGGYQEFVKSPQPTASPAVSASPSASPSSTATPLAQAGVPSPQVSPPLNPSATPVAPQKPPLSSVPPAVKSGSNSSPATSAKRNSEAIADIYQRTPKTGKYYAASPLLNASSREIASNQGRVCIKIIDGPVAPVAGNQQITVSSISLRKDGIYVDATQEKLKFDRSYTELSDRQGTWQLLEGMVDRSGAMEECLTTGLPYARQEQGAFIKGSQ